MMFDIASTKEAISLGGSMLALASTGYFWLVRANRERAQVEVCPVGTLWGNVPLPQEDSAAYQHLRPEEGCIVASYGVDLAVVNNSTLPNALLKARAWLELADGTWKECYVRAWEGGDQPLRFPVNLCPLTTAPLSLTLSFAIPGNYDGGFQGRAETAGNALAAHPRVRVELLGLRNRTFFADLPLEAEGLQRTVVKLAA